jgi:hypothetical protein
MLPSCPASGALLLIHPLLSSWCQPRPACCWPVGAADACSLHIDKASAKCMVSLYVCNVLAGNMGPSWLLRLSACVGVLLDAWQHIPAIYLSQLSSLHAIALNSCCAV